MENGRRRVAKKSVECRATRPAEGDAGSPCEVHELNLTDLRYELRNLLASIQLAVDTMARCRPTCPTAAFVKGNVGTQIARLSKLLDDLDRAAVSRSPSSRREAGGLLKDLTIHSRKTVQ